MLRLKWWWVDRSQSFFVLRNWALIHPRLSALLQNCNGNMLLSKSRWYNAFDLMVMNLPSSAIWLLPKIFSTMRLQKANQFDSYWSISGITGKGDADSICYHICNSNPDIPAKGLTNWVKNSTSSNGMKLFEMESSTDRKLCKFIQDAELFADCPICCQLLNTQDIFTCEKDCKALYHKECIYKWMRKSLSCPNCRFDTPKTANLRQSNKPIV